MANRFVTHKISPQALQSARLIAAKTGERQYQAVERVLAAEARKLGLTAAKPSRAVAPATSGT